jgi:hypothetical protein
VAARVTAPHPPSIAVPQKMHDKVRGELLLHWSKDHYTENLHCQRHDHHYDGSAADAHRHVAPSQPGVPMQWHGLAIRSNAATGAIVHESPAASATGALGNAELDQTTRSLLRGPRGPR